MNIQRVLATKGTHVVTTRPYVSIKEAITTMATHNIGALVVVNDVSQPIGIISERDIIRAAVHNDTVLSLSIDAIMNQEFIIGTSQDDLEAVAHTMTEKRIRHIPVVEQGKLVGIISIGDIVKTQRDQYLGELYTLQSLLLTDTSSGSR